jgi:hypothetical protein
VKGALNECAVLIVGTKKGRKERRKEVLEGTKAGRKEYTKAKL